MTPTTIVFCSAWPSLCVGSFQFRRAACYESQETPTSSGGSVPVLPSQRDLFYSQPLAYIPTVNYHADQPSGQCAAEVTKGAISLIAEILPESYDITGRNVFRPDSRRHSGFRPTFPVGRFLSQPLQHSCSNFVELRRFLAGCTYMLDEDQFGEKDFWQPPDQFEESKKGDCEDFALWAWRQLLQMNYDARFVIGISGQYRAGHAWGDVREKREVFPTGSSQLAGWPKATAPVNLPVQTEIFS